MRSILEFDAVLLDHGVNASLLEQERKAVAQLGMGGAIVEIEQLDPHRHSGPHSRTLPALSAGLEWLEQRGGVAPAARGQGTSSALAQAAVAELRARGAGTIQNLICIEDQDAHAFWESQGFERDMVRLSLYESR